MSKKKSEVKVKQEARAAQPAQPAPPAPGSPEPSVPSESQDPSSVDEQQDVVNALSPENNPPSAADDTIVLQHTPDPEPPVTEEPPVEDPHPSDDDEAPEQEGDLRIADTGRVLDEIPDGGSFVVGLNRKVDIDKVITKKLKSGEHSFQVRAFHGEMLDDHGKPFYNYLVSHVYDVEKPLEKPIEKSFMKGKFEVVGE